MRFASALVKKNVICCFYVKAVGKHRGSSDDEKALIVRRVVPTRSCQASGRRSPVHVTELIEGKGMDKARQKGGGPVRALCYDACPCTCASPMPTHFCYALCHRAGADFEAVNFFFFQIVDTELCLRRL